MSIYRKQFTQAKLNLSHGRFLVFEILIVSFGTAAYFESIYVFAIALFSILALFFSVIRVIRPLTFEEWSSK